MTSVALGLLAAAGWLPLQGAALEGFVRSSDGDRPVAYAQVRVMGDSLSDWTGRDGAYQLSGLEPGEWELEVVHPGHDPFQLAVAVPGDRPVRLDVILTALPGPPVEPLADFEPFRVEFTLPSLVNAEDVQRVLQALYPPELADDRIGGEAVLLLWLDERGRVARSELAASSGLPALDSIAVVAADSMRFRPARSRVEPVRVFVRIPVLFTVPDSVDGQASPRPNVRLGGSGL